MYELTPGEIPRDPNPISVYLRENKTFSIEPIPEVLILEAGELAAQERAEFPLAGFQNPLLLKSIWVSAPDDRERDEITFKVIENGVDKFIYTLREQDSPADLPFIVVLPSQSLCIIPRRRILGATVFARLCAVIYRTT